MNSLSELRASVDARAAGNRMYAMIEEMYPFCRSITGDGVRRTLEVVARRIPLAIHEVPTGTQVLDWTIPKEWNIRDAYIKNPRGEKVVDFKKSNLHVVGYSTPIHATLKLEELKSHLFTLPEHPDLTPYRTSYYAENWGFCLPHNELLRWEPGQYEVCIDSSLEPGALTYGEFCLPGETDQIILLSCHTCHPSLCNDNLSGISLLTLLAEQLTQVPLRLTYVFLFIPGTIGSITWLSRNRDLVPRIRHGLVVTNAGDSGWCHYKKSRRGDAEIDRAVAHVLQHAGSDFGIRDFSPYGYDERQFCSPGFNLPVGSFSRSIHGTFPEYHTSADNLTFVRPEHLADSFSKCLAVLDVLESNRTYLNQYPYGEPQLGKRGLYRKVGGQSHSPTDEFAMLWVLNLSDGHHSLLDIAERSDMEFDTVGTQARRLLEHGLLSECESVPRP
jgi:aminopeptidase-like protein